MKYYLMLACLLPLLMWCSEDACPEHCKLAGNIMTRFINDAKKEYGLYCYGSGGGFLDQVNRIHFAFATEGPKSLEDLREMMVIIAEDFLKRINSQEDIRKYLVHYPFKPDDLEFRITLMGSNGKAIHNNGKEKELLRSILLLNGELSYEIENDEKACLQDVYEETYEEAQAIIRREHPELFLDPSDRVKESCCHAP